MEVGGGTDFLLIQSQRIDGMLNHCEVVYIRSLLEVFNERIPVVAFGKSLLLGSGHLLNFAEGVQRHLEALESHVYFSHAIHSGLRTRLLGRVECPVQLLRSKVMYRRVVLQLIS
jgi:hypothetical protein